MEFIEKPPKLSSFAFDVLDSAKGAVIAVFIIFAFILRPVAVEGTSMVPTLNDKDWVCVAGAYTGFKRGDIVVINQPWERNVPIIKRIIALEGDEVYIDFDDNTVYVNGAPLDEPYIAEPTRLKYDVEYPVKVEKGKVFVMGDNRNDSLDSRSSKIGNIDVRYIVGKAELRAYPFSQMSIYSKGEKKK